MLNRTRIFRLYTKDLLDILRDRRTLIAMVIVPIVLYPGLMMAALWLASLQSSQIKAQQIKIGVQTENIGHWLQDEILLPDTQREELKKKEAEQTGLAYDEPEALGNSVIAVEPLRSNIEALINTQDIAVGLIFELDNIDDLNKPHQLKQKFKIIIDSSRVASQIAGQRLQAVIRRTGEFEANQRIVEVGLPLELIHPFEVEKIDIASAEKRGGSLLGQIVPIVLILMTITGAIYPAIDLTAGERERGTLETLLVCPIPIGEIIGGKFLVVVTVSLIGAVLNLTSMGLTLQLGGIGQAIADDSEVIVPLTALPMVLLCLIPLSLMFSALLLAVCSFARTFKEAQNYITPVIIAALMPAAIAAMPGAHLDAVMSVLPVANMVLLTRELLIGNVPISAMLAVVLSTCLYALTAITVAVKIFGQEAVLFADSGSWRAQFDRRMIRAREYPTLTMVLLYVTLLFPIWFYIQVGTRNVFENPIHDLILLMLLMVLVFGVVPVLLIKYYRVNLVNTFRWRPVAGRYLLAALLIGISTWVLGREIMVFQWRFDIMGMKQFVTDALKLDADYSTLSPLLAVVLLALMPAICEELLFRGMLQTGLGQVFRKWPTLITVATVFAVYHFAPQRFAITFLLGLVLAYAVWQSGAIWPAMIMHFMHNGLSFLMEWKPINDQVTTWLNMPAPDAANPLVPYPLGVFVGAVVCFIGGLLLLRKHHQQL
ncbi:MAG: hypothetical protein HJJLKODD_02236 [Phycisphaerae bacterium]|nr:hypothetical protein [Phycisphaerae bacterium]